MKSLLNKIKGLIYSQDVISLLDSHHEILKTIAQSEEYKTTLIEMEKNLEFSYSKLKNLFTPLLNSYNYPESSNFEKDLYEYVLSLSFPDKFSYDSNYLNLYKFFMLILRELYSQEKDLDAESNLSKYKVELLDEDEFSHYESSTEYSTFIQSYYNLYVYEAMRLGLEFKGFNTIDHVIMIHHLATFIGKQMTSKHVEIDLGKVSAASMGHDIGKFGCIGDEVSRVPYLHYYYTDKWFKDNAMPMIGHIATNHSVWDIELENLPIESLVLIYSDFRVKNDAKGKMNIFSLDESFDVILEKLDNVDEQKTIRYKRAYGKLKDFENYLLSLNIDILDESKPKISAKPKPYALLFDQEITDNLKFYSISKNITIMHLLRSEASLTHLLEYARTERNPLRLREYIDVFKEYSTHLSQKQKLLMMKFLFDMTVHHEEDIRIESATFLGKLISNFDEEYRKELPKNAVIDNPETNALELFSQYATKMIEPNIKTIPIHKKWLGLSFAYFMKTVSIYIPDGLKTDFENLCAKLLTNHAGEENQIKYLLLALISIELRNENTLNDALFLALHSIKSENEDIKALALLLLIGYRHKITKDSVLYSTIEESLQNNIGNLDNISFNYLSLELSKALGIKDLEYLYEQAIQSTKSRLSEIFLNNLKSATSFIQKIVHIDILKKNALENINYMGAYTAMHFCNILKVSEIEIVRTKAGHSLIEIFPHLNIEQRNDIAIELIRSLEMQDYKFAKFIPHYLGEILLYISPKEFDEILDDFEMKIKTSESNIVFLILKTLGRYISLYSRYYENYPQESKNYKSLFRIVGILMCALVHYEKKVRRAALEVISKDIFDCLTIDETLKASIFKKMAKKMLTLLPPKTDDIGQLSIGSSMNRIYRYICEYELENGAVEYENKKNIAFFPGTFDPFTLGHKSIAKTIRDMGLEVYLSVDEFSWSKRTQPHMIRREIARMAVADEFDIYLYPSSMPVNIANDKDVDHLVNNFPNRDVHMVTGKDVIYNASAYRGDYKIRELPHIVFEREDMQLPKDANEQEDFKQYLKKPYTYVQLDDAFTHISSTLIRSCIDQDKDISNMVDPLCEKYIYDKGLYKKEPLFKSDAKEINRRVEIYKHPPKTIIAKLAQSFADVDLDKLFAFIDDENTRCIALLNDHSSEVLGFSVFKWLPSTSIYSRFEDKTVCDFIRNVYVGRIVHLGGIFGNKETMTILFTETLTYSLGKDYTFMIYSNETMSSENKALEEIITLSGFTHIQSRKSIYYVNMSNPCTLNLDLENFIKEPFLNNDKIQSTIESTRTNLQTAIAKLYPANLIIPFDNKMFKEKLIAKICEENQVPHTPTVPRKLGEKICVPFGHILSKLIIPNTVSKSLHTEKIFNKDLSGFTVRAYPFYLSLDKQVKTIKSFAKEVILVDDILNKGYRINALDPILKRQNVKVSKVIVGILTGKGKELMEIQGRDVDSAYFIPKLNVWFNEGILYPFISGDGIEDANLIGSMIPSINLILPYTSPHYIKDTNAHDLYNFSMTCLENAYAILKSLEEVYEELFERRLTVSALNEVLVYPRVVDYGNNLEYSKNQTPSSYVLDDIERLKRLKKMILK